MFPTHFCLNTCSAGDNYAHPQTVDTVTSRSLISIGKDYYISEHSSMVFIQSNDRKERYEFRAIQKSCKMKSMYKFLISESVRRSSVLPLRISS